MPKDFSIRWEWKVANLNDLDARKAPRGEALIQRISKVTAAGGIAWSVPNQITVLRILLAPLFVGFLIYEMRVSALVVFCLSGVTDALDGVIARRFNQETELGAILDPVADKVLLVSSFWVLAGMGFLPTWLAILVISRDIMIVAGAMYMRVFEEESVMLPTLLGKITTCVQLVTIFWTLLFYFIGGHEMPYLRPLSVTAGIITFVSGFQYLFSFMRRVGESP